MGDMPDDTPRKIVYECGDFRVMRGAGCPKEGKAVRFRATYEDDPYPEGFYGYGETKEEAKADLEHYAGAEGRRR